jgi:hypothetical protein
MRTVRVFISYARVDAEDAAYVRSQLEGLAAYAPPVGLREQLALPRVRAFARIMRTSAKSGLKGVLAGPSDQELDELRAASLIAVRLETWMDEDSRSGDWSDIIQRAIEDSSCFVVLAPQRPSTFVTKECAVALTSRVPLVPLARSLDDLKPLRLAQHPALRWPRTSASWDETLTRVVRDRIAGIA